MILWHIKDITHLISRHKRECFLKLMLWSILTSLIISYYIISTHIDFMLVVSIQMRRRRGYICSKVSWWRAFIKSSNLFRHIVISSSRVIVLTCIILFKLIKILLLILITSSLCLAAIRISNIIEISKLFFNYRSITLFLCCQWLLLMKRNMHIFWELTYKWRFFQFPLLIIFIRGMSWLTSDYSYLWQHKICTLRKSIGVIGVNWVITIRENLS